MSALPLSTFGPVSSCAVEESSKNTQIATALADLRSCKSVDQFLTAEEKIQRPLCLFVLGLPYTELDPKVALCVRNVVKNRRYAGPKLVNPRDYQEN